MTQIQVDKLQILDLFYGTHRNTYVLGIHKHTLMDPNVTSSTKLISIRGFDKNKDRVVWLKIDDSKLDTPITPGENIRIQK